MNPAYFGDSYDLVKRFFCHELVSLGYTIAIDPMFTGSWNGTEQHFYRLIGASPESDTKSSSKRRALFIDPDTGVNPSGSKSHVSYDRLAKEAAHSELVFSFDQSFSRRATPTTVMQTKLAALQALNCRAMYYDSHARFLFVSKEWHPLHELRVHLVSLGLPESRLLAVGI